jgi:hypothetical protein
LRLGIGGPSGEKWRFGPSKKAPFKEAACAAERFP